jgi:hypothetical protein
MYGSHVPDQEGRKLLRKQSEVNEAVSIAAVITFEGGQNAARSLKADDMLARKASLVQAVRRLGSRVVVSTAQERTGRLRGRGWGSTLIEARSD